MAPFTSSATLPHFPAQPPAAASEGQRLGRVFSRFHQHPPAHPPSRGLADSLWDPPHMHPLFRDSHSSSSSSLVSLEADCTPCLTSLPHALHLKRPAPQPSPQQGLRSKPRDSGSQLHQKQPLGAREAARHQASSPRQVQPEGTGHEKGQSGLEAAPHVAGVFPDMGQALAATRQLLSFMGDQSSQVSSCVRLLGCCRCSGQAASIKAQQSDVSCFIYPRFALACDP